MGHQKQPLYRKVNTKARGHGHRVGGDYRHERRTQAAQTDATHAPMSGRDDRGLDYTPLFRFLLSSVGRDWTAVFTEACARLDREAPIFWLVARREDERRDTVRLGENSLFSGLYVDAENRLQIVNPRVTVETLTPSCDCCTHTFNGVRIVSAAKAQGR